MTKQKGFVKIIVLALILFAVAAFLLLRTQEPVLTGLMSSVQEQVSFEKLEEDTSVPEVIDNSAVEELDALMEEIDAMPTEDLSDLDL